MPPPIPKRAAADFLVKGSPSAPVSLDFHGDLQCPYSKKAFATMKEVLTELGPDKIKFTFQPTVLFTHQWAWIVTRGAAVVGCLKPDKWYDFVDYCFEHQEEYQHAAGENKTPKQMEALMAKFAKEVADIDEEAFATEYASDRNFLTAKEPQRVAIVRQIWSVPTFFVNGFENDKVGSSTSKDEWVAYLKDMVGDGGAAGGAGK